jgi:hypothetical protein
MNNKQNPKMVKNIREEITSKTKEKLNTSVDIDSIVKNGETRNAINNLAKNLIDSTNRN